MSRAARLGTYLTAMFPPWVLLPSAVASFLALHFGLQALGEPSIQAGDLALTWRMLLGALTLFGLQLLLRVYDELKDAETDIRLGNAGDPRYKDRPIVTGEVTVEDLEGLRNGVVGALLALNFLTFDPWVWLAFLGVYFLCWLSSRWFFWPAVSRHLLLAFLTHNPLTLAVGLYVLTLYVVEFPVRQPLGWEVAVLLLGLYLPVAAWEIGRKVRLPDEETDYQTYSKILGWRLAASLPAALVACSAVCLSLVLRQLEMSWVGPAVLIVGAAPPCLASLALLIAPAPGRSNLRPLLEGYLLTTNVGLTIVWAATFGLRWGA